MSHSGAVCVGTPLPSFCRLVGPFVHRPSIYYFCFPVWLPALLWVAAFGKAAAAAVFCARFCFNFFCM